MLLCLFCQSPLTPDTKPEHVLLDAFGGRMKTRRADCSTCNERFGGSIDSAFAKQVIPLRNLLQLRSGSGDPPPKMPRVSAGDRVLNIGADGSMQLAGKPFVIEKREDGSWNVQIHARSGEHFQALMPNIAAQLGISPDSLEAQMLDSATVIEQRLWPGPVGNDLQLGDPEALRSMVKSALVLWSELVGNAEVRSEPYAAARRFVVEGDEAFSLRRIEIDSRRLPCGATTKIAYGPLFNLIHVRSDAEGKVIGHFTLYNMLGWQFVLAERGGIPNQRIALISNPEKPREWSAAVAELLDLPMAWFEQPELDFGIARQRMIDIGHHYHQTATEREIGRIVDETARDSGLMPNQVIPSDQVEPFSNMAAWRVMNMIMRTPQERRLTQDQIARWLGGSKRPKA